MSRQQRIQQIDQALADLEKANDLADLQTVIEALREALSVDHLIYHWVNSKGASTVLERILMNGEIDTFQVDT